ncbi:histidinol dehydrogenase [Nakamurella sp. PAMC28650]|jgi:histidinol dehydrogenase|uniref:histidinol dehydrogenase n=1 Tax=Nakamurella sp. PAMC28650 TaxID=2762325 RepID=UPI00164E8340|nr:histidinol dehydrogenase [Nakamurella sp. PAMC28650]QNK79651.1 histidinol dehydrogenase [Nakamurella sp. PAMC28650]
MLRRIDLRQGLGNVRNMLPRAAIDVSAAVVAVAPLVEDVRKRGSAAVLDATEKFDGLRPTSLRVPAQVIADAVEALDPAVRAALLESISRARIGHSAQVPTERVTQIAPGGTVTQRWVPVRRVGLYVPGGLAVYPSSVVMNVVPAQVAGVTGIAVTSPPQKSTGWPDATVLAACGLLGVSEVYAAGGAQAIAMLGYGVIDVDGTTIEPVDVITGPGNVYVTAAKRLLRGVVAIDAEAGPTEIAILADEKADADHVAADLVSQAEHDPMAASVLITTSIALANAVEDKVIDRVVRTKHSDRVTAALTGPQSAIVVVASLEDGIKVADAYAAEHLEIQTTDAPIVARRIRNAGAIFVGKYSPVSLGDYCAGSNHVLPTAGCARFSSGLATTTFLKQMQVIEYSRDALAAVADHVLALSSAENLPAHGEAVSARFPDGLPR